MITLTDDAMAEEGSDAWQSFRGCRDFLQALPNVYDAYEVLGGPPLPGWKERSARGKGRNGRVGEWKEARG